MSRVAEIWATAAPATAHPFLEAAGVRAYGLRIYKKPTGDDPNEFLLIPVHNSDGELVALQYFYPGQEVAFFPRDLDLRGGEHFLMGKPNGSIAVLEDYLSAARHHETTGEAVAVAFTASNVENVVRVLKAKYPAAAVGVANETAKPETPQSTADEMSEQNTSDGRVADEALLVTAPVTSTVTSDATSDLPAPPVPAWADLRNFPRIQFDRRRLFASDFHAIASANPQAYLAGFILWMKALDQIPAGSLPDDDVVLCHLAELGSNVQRWHDIKHVALRRWRKHSDGRLYHPVVAESVLDALKAKSQPTKARIEKLRKQLKETNEPLERARLENEVEKMIRQLNELAALSVTCNVTLSPSPSPSPSSNKRANRKRGSARTPASSSIPDCPHDELIALYHQILPMCPQVRLRSKTRDGDLRSRWQQMAKPNGAGRGYVTKEEGLAWWTKFFEHVAKSSFLTGQVAGRDGKPPFIASLAWLVKEGKFINVIEGNYNDTSG